MAGRCLCTVVTILGLSLAVATVRADSTSSSVDPVCDMILVGGDRIIAVLRSDPWLYNFALSKGDTVLDAVAKVPGLPASLHAKKEIWVERPRPGKDGYEILPVDWKGIVKQGISTTNYLLQPGDRIYIKARRI